MTGEVVTWKGSGLVRIVEGVMEEDTEIGETAEILLRKEGILEVMETVVTRIKVDIVMELIEEIHVVATLMTGEQGIIEEVQAVKEVIGELTTVNGEMNPGDLKEVTAEMIHVDITVMTMIEETREAGMMIEIGGQNHARSHETA